MAKDWTILCGSDRFFDPNVTWIGDRPEFSNCFRKTVLVWSPCLLFWFLFPFQLESIRKKSSVYWFHFSKLSLVNFCVLLSLIIIIMTTFAFNQFFFKVEHTITKMLKQHNQIKLEDAKIIYFLYFIFWFCLHVTIIG